MIQGGAKQFHINDVVFSLPGYTGDPQWLIDLLGAVEQVENRDGESRASQLESRKRHLLAVYPEADEHQPAGIHCERTEFY